MGRGLSELQKKILGIVYERRLGRDFEAEEREWREDAKDNPYMKDVAYWVGYDMTHPEVIVALYDWPIRTAWWRREKEVHPWDHNFRRDVIGHDEYNRKTAAYYRSVKRLKDRGLLTNRGIGLWITDEGLRVAEVYSPTS